MSSLKNSPFGKRLRASRATGDENSPSRKRRRLNLDSSSSPTRTLATAALNVTNTPSRRHKSRNSLGSEDRFIPSRDQNSFWASYGLDEKANNNTSPFMKPSVRRWSLPDPKKEQADELYKSVLRSELSSSPVAFHSLSRTSFSENSPNRLDDPMGSSYQVSPLHQETGKLMNQPRPEIRQVAKMPIRMLDAPGLSHDFYTNLVDWAPSGALAVGLDTHVYLSSGDNEGGAKLCTVLNSSDEYTSLAWMKTGPTIAAGTAEGHLEIHDASTLRLIRRYEQAHVHDAGNRIGTLSWTSNTLTSGSRDRMIKHWDFRDPTCKPIKQCAAHTQEVCGVKWSGDGGIQTSLLATGGNDNKMFIWDLRSSVRDLTAGAGWSSSILSENKGGSPLYRFNQHKAAVKGLAWDPHLSNVLASGAGQQDACIRLWNTATGTMLNETRTGSQICNLIWSINTHELVTTHGYSTQTVPNQIRIWKYPSMSLVASLPGHTECVQYVALSPSGDTIVTGGGDETLRFWNIFPGRVSPFKGKHSALDYGKLIR
ncbi:WD40-repeat-containing domain protein [Lentinula detonsa]|uniref:WD40-repeat-containing domain protein n=1 Tax=Lentinula detonsa TaxID=2804962 RepID=A0A9W8NUD8_9AGAR|nr:WD40-repeat-containing domain protein [Lentinula detonsa]